MQLDGTKKVCTAKSGCLCIADASHVSPAAIHERFAVILGKEVYVLQAYVFISFLKFWLMSL